MEETPYFTKLQELSRSTQFQMKPIDVFWIDPDFKGGNYLVQQKKIEKWDFPFAKWRYFGFPDFFIEKLAKRTLTDDFILVCHHTHMRMILRLMHDSIQGIRNNQGILVTLEENAKIMTNYQRFLENIDGFFDIVTNFEDMKEQFAKFVINLYNSRVNSAIAVQEKINKQKKEQQQKDQLKDKFFLTEAAEVEISDEEATEQLNS